MELEIERIKQRRKQMHLYKIYKNKKHIGNEINLTALRERLNLTKEQTKKCFYSGVHKVAGYRIISLVN